MVKAHRCGENEFENESLVIWGGFGKKTARIQRMNRAGETAMK